MISTSYICEVFLLGHHQTDIPKEPPHRDVPILKVRIGDTLEDIDEVPNSSIIQEKVGKVDFLIVGSFTV
jgi:hypothetical protein